MSSMKMEEEDQSEAEEEKEDENKQPSRGTNRKEFGSVRKLEEEREEDEEDTHKVNECVLSQCYTTLHSLCL